MSHPLPHTLRTPPTPPGPPAPPPRWRPRRTALRALLALISLAAALLAPRAQAHEMSMAEMVLRESARGEFIWQWGPTEKRPAAEVLTPHWPEGCTADGVQLHCGAQGLRGVMTVDGVGRDFSAALIRITWLDGQERVHTLTAAQPELRLFGTADDTRGLWEVGGAYAVLGVEHILSGTDHLLFVLGLLLLVGFNRRLVATITAFTLAHSLTLGFSALGWLQLRPPPVEAVIALSIVLVAAEALHQRATLSRRWPALVAFLFGLVHGLGFAGALRAYGLPQQHLLSALLAFNLGVEAGQLGAVGLCWALAAALQRLAGASPARLAPARTLLLYGVGTMAAFWSWQRLAALGS